MRQGRWMVGAGVVAGALAVPAGAQAVTIGSLDGSNAAGALNSTLVMSKPGTVPFTVPAGSWAVTSVSARLKTDDVDGTSAAVYFFRPTAQDNQFLTLGQTPLTVTRNVLDRVYTATPSPLNVQGGDLLGIDTRNALTLSQPDTDAFYRGTATAPAAGATMTTTFGVGGFAPSVAATLEPDTDGDGVADLADGCTRDATKSAGPCATDVEGLVQVNPSSVLRGRTVQVAVSTSNRGVDPASGVNTLVTLPTGVRVLSSGDRTACPLRQSPVRCSFGTLPGGATRTVYLRVRAESEGLKTLSLLAGHAGTDAVAGNNRSQIALTVRKTCIVPSKGLNGQTLKTAKRRLKAAGCAKTKTVKPKRVRAGYVLRVSSVSPKATQEANKRITITLKARKKKR